MKSQRGYKKKTNQNYLLEKILTLEQKIQNFP